MRNYEVVIWGASGFTGRLVAEYLLKQYGLGKDLSWAMAGRNKAKLEKIRTELGNENIPILIADSQDEASLNAMAKDAKVICSTVGPFAKYGSKLVAACVANKTHYCDITGEVQWIRQMIDAHHETAKADGTKIVHCCGFDSVPSDMGVYFFQRETKAETGEYLKQIKYRLKAMKGGGSGGTYASLLNVLDEGRKDKSIFKVLANPYGLNPETKNQGNDERDLQTVKYDPDLGGHISPFVMGPINTKIVRRSHALNDFPYGKEFRYDEATIVGKGIGKRLQAYGAMAAIGLVLSSKEGSFVRNFANKRMPKPGEGPSKEAREAGFFNILLLGKQVNGEWIKAKVTGDKDPGYGSTSKMLGEAAVCLAKDSLSDVSGVLTPSTAMGDHFLNRLTANAGLTFEML